MATSGLANTPRIPWGVLHTWIKQKQHYESEHNQPAPLTTEEEKALMPLVRLLSPARPADPVLADGNCVGELQELMQKYDLGLPKYQEEAVPVLPGSPPLFRCYVQAARLPSAVPGPYYGLGPDGACPAFANKKKAKTYAAQCALECLKPKFATGRFTEASDGIQAPVSANRQDPMPLSPPSKRARVTAEEPAQAQKATAESSRRSEPKPNSSANRLDGVNSSNPSSRHNVAIDVQESFVAKLSKLCQDIGLESPRYKLTPTSGGYFNGEPVFKLMPIDMPPDLGHIHESLGKKETKERVAEAVYTFMYHDHQEHLKRVGNFMKDMNQPPDN